MADIAMTFARTPLGALVLSPCVGSLLGVLIHRLPAGRPVALTRSTCAGCGRTLSAVELVPLLSYLCFRGRCRCGVVAIGRFHLAVEVAALAVPFSAALAGQTGAVLWAGCLLGWGLLVLAWIDAATFTLPDALTLPLVPAGLVATWWIAPTALARHAVAAVLGYAAFALLRLTWRAWRGIEGIGAGDAKLLAVGGAWAGLAALPNIVLGAGLAGLVLVGTLRLTGRDVGPATRLPFGPPLAVAIWAAWLLLPHG